MSVYASPLGLIYFAEKVGSSRNKVMLFPAWHSVLFKIPRHV